MPLSIRKKLAPEADVEGLNVACGDRCAGLWLAEMVLLERHGLWDGVGGRPTSAHPGPLRQIVAVGFLDGEFALGGVA